MDVQAIVMARLEAAGVAPAVRGMRREGTGACVFVIATGGPPSIAHSHGDFDRPTVQLLTRSARGKQEDGRLLAVAARTALHRVGWEHDGVTVLQAVVREPHPYPLTSDDDNAASYWTNNVEIWVAP